MPAESRSESDSARCQPSESRSEADSARRRPSESRSEAAAARPLGADTTENRDGSDSLDAGFSYITPSMAEFELTRQAMLVMNYDASLQEQTSLDVYWKNPHMTVYT
jgi:hypothetical protein